VAILTPVRALVATLVVSAALTVGLHGARQEGSAAEDIKAAYLFNFTRFVEWPPSADTGPFRICVVGDPRFASAVEQIIVGESADGRPLTRVHPNSVEEARSCRILFVGPGQPELGNRLLAGVKQLPVLTVSDNPGFLEHGGVVRFVLDNRRVRFDVSLPAAGRAGLKVSSKLLRVARVIKTDVQ
jgi:hypothetical protein